MAARIFISYRTADGMDKAVALARDLGRTFGDEQVFLDKDDLRGGSRWRSEIGHTLETQPVLLLLLTPQLIEAVGADGKLRIADAEDPVRVELMAAMEVGATVIPLLCDGLAAAPDAAHLPEPFNRIGELTWRKLRAYDWVHDVERIVADLRALGVAPEPAAFGLTPAANAIADPLPASASASASAPAPGSAPHSALARLAWAAAAVLVAAVAIGWWRGATEPDAAPAPAPVASSPDWLPPPAPTEARTAPGALASSAAAAPSTPGSAPAPAPKVAPQVIQKPAEKPAMAPTGIALSGRWAARLSHGEQAVLVVTQTGSRVVVVSEPVPIAMRADWAEYRAFWRERTATELNAVMYRGEGQLIADPGVAPRIDIAITVHPSPGGGAAIDSGNLSATLSADGRTLTGTLWRNSMQAEQPAVLKRR